MGYTDKELVAYSQLAYKTLPDPSGKDMTLEDAIVTEFRENSCKGPECNSAKEYLNNKCEELNMSREDMQSCKILDVHDENDNNGFYAYIIETSPGNAVIAFRGSEKMTEFMNAKHDWTEADLALVNNYCTEQQAEVLKFLKKNKDILEKYNITLTGHSLGGNLAEFAAIAIAKEKELNHLIDNVDKCVSLDSPGHSEEYIEKNCDSIEVMSEKIYSKKFSIVGNLLFPLPGVNYQDYKVKDGYTGFAKHSMKNWVVEDGYFEEKKAPDYIDKLIGDISREIDKMNPIVGNTLVNVASTLFLTSMFFVDLLTDDEEEKLTLNSMGKMVVSFVAGLIILSVVGGFAIPLIVTLIKGVVILISLVFAISLVKEFITAVIDYCKDTLSNVFNWASDKINELKEMLIDSINKALSYLNNLFMDYIENRGYTSHIVVDTYRLRDYASRINSIHARVINLGARMDRLYWSVGVEGAYNLMRADAVTGYSSKLRRCASYLNDAADIFDNVERDITAKV